MSIPTQQRIIGRFGQANTMPHFGSMTTRDSTFNFGRMQVDAGDNAQQLLVFGTYCGCCYFLFVFVTPS